MLLAYGKGGKECLVPLSKVARYATKDWLKTRDKKEKIDAGEKPSEFLFLSRSKSRHLTRQQFYILIKTAAPKANVSVNLGFSSLATAHLCNSFIVQQC